MIKVDFTGKTTALFAVFIMLVRVSSQLFQPHSLSADIDIYYSTQLRQLQENISSFKSMTEKKAAVPVLKKHFFKCRITYKKLSVLSDYFNPYETKLLNGPAQQRIESGVVDRILSPQGFQAIEELLFGEWETNNYPELLTLQEDVLSTLSKMEKEPDRHLKFKDDLTWDAMRSAMVQVMTTGITGFDSPLAVYSIPEAKASIAGVSNILRLYESILTENGTGPYTVLKSEIGRTTKYLEKNSRFSTFDRMEFIRQYMNPMYAALVRTRIASGVGVPGGRSAINYDAVSLFSPDALNINFYSPPPEYWVSPERVALGALLFSDPVLSGNKDRSCASCHIPQKAFTDGLAKPYALDNETLLNRNTPTLLNSGFQTRQFHDSRTDLLENQLSEVVHNPEEMKGSMKASAELLKKSPQYLSLFKKAYPQEKEPVSSFTIANAISSYVRSLRSLNSAFDVYMRGETNELAEPAKRGFNLFTGKAKCASCHFIPLFNGVVPPAFAETESEVLGVPSTKDKNQAVLDTDPGKFSFTGSVIHKYAFKTPTLRNIELTAPYMHNGVYNTLEEVMEFYNNGGGAGLGIAPENQTLPREKLDLSKKDISDIIAFMKTLTDTSSYR